MSCFAKQHENMSRKVLPDHGIMTRPCWTPMHRLEVNQDYQATEMTNADWLFDRLVNVPSSVRA